MRLLIIGGGSMGAAIVRGVVQADLMPPNEVGVVEVDVCKRRAIGDSGCVVYASPEDAMPALNDQSEVLFAVKPQTFPEVARSFSPVTRPRIFISIMAGVDSGRLHRALGPQSRIVRCMPNMPCQVRAGMTAIALGMGSRSGDDALAREVFESLGRTIVVDESSLHAVTAVSGSGPAYVFLLAEAMNEAAVAVGLAPDIARLLVKQTLVGAGAMLQASRADAIALRRAVTSPGGTTEAALRVFRDAALERVVAEAITAARDRSIELGEAPPAA